jgi:hypothetical protein
VRQAAGQVRGGPPATPVLAPARSEQPGQLGVLTAAGGCCPGGLEVEQAAAGPAATDFGGRAGQGAGGCATTVSFPGSHAADVVAGMASPAIRTVIMHVPPGRAESIARTSYSQPRLAS